MFEVADLGYLKVFRVETEAEELASYCLYCLIEKNLDCNHCRVMSQHSNIPIVTVSTVIAMRLLLQPLPLSRSLLPLRVCFFNSFSGQID